MDGVFFALLLAQSAADAGGGADAHSRLALVLVGAAYVNLLGHGDGGNQVPGAGGGAGHAGGALVRVHHGGAAGADGHGAELARGHTGAKAQAAEGALQGTARDLRRGDAVLDAHIVKALFRVHAAGAADESHLPLPGGSLHAHDFGDGGGVFRPGGSAGGDGSFSRQNGGGTAAAAGIAAAAAVGPGQQAQDGLLTGVLLYLENLGGHGQDQAEDRAQNAQDGHRE